MKGEKAFRKFSLKGRRAGRAVATGGGGWSFAFLLLLSLES